MLSPLLIVLVQATTVTAPAPDSDGVTVVGRRQQQTTADDLARCLAEHCPPKKDIEVSLAHAFAQLEAGDYHGSRRTLLAARKRSARYAAELPDEVAEIHRSNARLAGMNGLSAPARIGMFDVVDALKKGLTRDDARIMLARLDVGSTFAEQGRIEAGLEHYRSVARDARKANMSIVEGMALFRRAALLTTIASVDPGSGSRARAATRDVMNAPHPHWAPFRNGLRLVPAILAQADQQERLLDEAMRSFEPYDYGSPKILFTPAVDLRDIGFGAVRGGEPEWIDLRFLVNAEGKVTDLEEIGRSEHFQASWVPPIARSLKLRRYSPPPAGSASPVVRQERYTFISDFVGSTGSGIPVRSSRRRVDILDLTPQANR